MRSSVRWLVPVAVAGVVAGGVAVNSAAAGNAPHLPQRTAEQVLETVASAHVSALSGTVVTRADIGLPSLASLGGQSGGDASSTDVQGLVTRFLSGDNTLRVWADGPTRQRAQLLDQFAELDAVRNGSDVWTYDSGHNTAQHAVLPARSASKSAPDSSSPAAQMTPAALAQRVLAAADPSTAITLSDPELVAGQPSYALTLTPKTSATLIDHVVIAVDAARGVPLQVQVFARGTTAPVIETGFTAIDFSTPAASEFDFTPPKGATVTPMTAPEGQAPSAAPHSRPAGTKPIEIGTGWATILEMPAAQLSSTSGSSPSASGGALLSELGTPVDGGRAITTKLVSVLITTDGRLFAGSVPVQALLDAAHR